MKKLFASLLIVSALFAPRSAFSQIPRVWFTNGVMIGTTDDTTINITAVNNPVGFGNSIYRLPPRGTNITTTNGIGSIRLIPGRYTAAYAGIPQSFQFSVTNSAITDFNVVDLMETGHGVVFYSGVQTIEGTGGLTVTPPTGPGGKWTIDASGVSGGNGSGNMTGPGSSTVSNLVIFNNTVGSLTKDSGLALSNVQPKNIFVGFTNSLAIGSGFSAEVNTNRFHAAADFAAFLTSPAFTGDMDLGSHNIANAGRIQVNGGYIGNTDAGAEPFDLNSDGSLRLINGGINFIVDGATAAAGWNIYTNTIDPGDGPEPALTISNTLSGAGAIVDIGGDFRAHTITSTGISGPGPFITALNASELTSGTVAPARLGSGGAGLGAKYLADDSTYKTISGGGDMLKTDNLSGLANNATARANIGAAASATTITIAGTANQITSSAGAQDLSANRTATLSIPSTFIAPGSVTATTFFGIDQWQFRTNASTHALSITNTTYGGSFGLTTNGVPSVNGVPLVDATALKASQYAATDGSTNLVSTQNGNNWTNIISHTHEGTTTNFTVTFKGQPSELHTVTNGPTVFFSYAGANGSVSYKIISTNFTTLSFSYQPKWLAGSNSVITNGVLSLTSYGGTNATQIEAAMRENQ